ncbi:hypothetical protein [Rufibacter latericius]|uniref:Phosphoadenosine phosphosulfate reductase n=1 Tax=Rufibacter latericius TaxID=2487040 RepID=A0A3M9MPI1_9BACT|nr:hypothetical protein [Rufibacter latericius]RNI26608.1 hypothetical protein EFB08_11355 [Rufibacter latericius]
MLIRLVKERRPIDYVFFSNTGGASSKGEKKATYRHIRLMTRWLKSKGYPSVKTLIYNREGLYQEVLRRESLPSIAFGFKTCSIKWKITPVDRYVAKHLKGRKLVKYVAYDASESHRIKDYSTEKERVVYPLVEWGMDRFDCMAYIHKAGLPVPQKSSCFFCPNMKEREIKQLQAAEPDLLEMALNLEKIALPNLGTVAGLGRGKRWSEMLKQTELFPEEDDYDNMPCECAA